MNALFKCIALLCRGAEPIQYMNPNVAYILLIITVIVHVILSDSGVLNFFERGGYEFFYYSQTMRVM